MTKSSSCAYRRISAVIGRLERNPRLYEASSFIERMEALDVLELHLLDAPGPVSVATWTEAEQGRLMERAEALKQKLVNANERLFEQLLHSIRSNDRAPVQAFFKAARQQVSSSDDDALGYDALDMLVNGLLEIALTPGAPEARDGEMVFYQPTPARIILHLIDALRPTAEDIFYDLGSGLGHVPILVHLLTGITTRGVELEDAYFRYANACLDKLGLTAVKFVHADARAVDYADGTLFYLYTPFQGEMLRQVLRKLEAQAERRSIKICTYGPCTLEVGRQSWLQSIFQAGQHEVRLGIFASS